MGTPVFFDKDSTPSFIPASHDRPPALDLPPPDPRVGADEDLGSAIAMAAADVLPSSTGEPPTLHNSSVVHSDQDASPVLEEDVSDTGGTSVIESVSPEISAAGAVSEATGEPHPAPSQY